MSEHRCARCAGSEADIRETRQEMVHLLRIAEKHPGTQAGKNSLARISVLKKRVAISRELQAAHLSEVSP